MRVIGIDPGVNTGIAVYEDGSLVHLETIQPMDYPILFSSYGIEPLFICFEDSRLQSHVWIPSQSKGVAANISRKIGMVDGFCYMLEQFCFQHGIAFFKVSPKQKGIKIDAELFKKLTRWDKRSNQHERDAAMIAWQFRSKNV